MLGELDLKVHKLFTSGKGQKMLKHCRDFYYTAKLLRVIFVWPFSLETQTYYELRCSSSFKPFMCPCMLS